MEHQGDSVLHPPSGSNVPGKEDANVYMSYPPQELRELLLKESDEGLREKMVSALKQWERIFVDNQYPYRRVSDILRKAARRLLAEIEGPAINLDYYQDSNIPDGYEEILDSLENPHDNEDRERFDFLRQGERPGKDLPFFDGNFMNPKTPDMDWGKVVKERGDGADPDGMECEDPPTGGDMDDLGMHGLNGVPGIRGAAMDFYEELLRGRDSLRTAQEETSGMDDFLSGDRIKVASIDDFFHFLRLSSDTLIHKAEKDLWRVSENKQGEVVIERLFDPNTKEPLKI